MLERHLQVWSALGIRRAILVLGYEHEKIRGVADRYAGPLTIEYALNDDYQRKGNTVSLQLGTEAAQADPIIIFDADLIYDESILAGFLQDPRENLLLVGNGHLSDVEATKVLVDEANRVYKVVDKREITSDELATHRFAGEALGILKFSGAGLELLRREASLFLSAERKENVAANWEYLLNRMLPQFKMQAHYCKSTRWIEIDTPEDYSRAQALLEA